MLKIFTTLSLHLNALLNKLFKLRNKKRNKYKCFYKRRELTIKLLKTTYLLKLLLLNLILVK
jgi:hypothetical protein